MPLNVSKYCFSTSIKCHNCERKISSHVKKVTNLKPVISQRCSNCHLLTYCDQDCQREHWLKVHKNHCRFLSGKTPFKNSKHNAATCVRCIGHNYASLTQLDSENSPETVCNIEEVLIAMKKNLGQIFGFHGEGTHCDCSQEVACELPFPLGEMSGLYVEMGSIDAMLAHSLKIINTMLIKAKKEEHKNALSQLWKDLIRERSQRWYDILVRGKPVARATRPLSDQVDSLQTIYGDSNPWWKSLKFSFDLIVNTNDYFESNFDDSDSMEVPRFKNLKLLTDYHQSQLQKEATVSKARTWPNFMMWPILVNESRACNLCLKSSLSTHRCSGCRAVQYCSTVCQTKDFEEFHRSVCASWAKDKCRTINGKGKQKDYWKSVLGK